MYSLEKLDATDLWRHPDFDCYDEEREEIAVEKLGIHWRIEFARGCLCNCWDEYSSWDGDYFLSKVKEYKKWLDKNYRGDGDFYQYRLKQYNQMCEELKIV